MACRTNPFLYKGNRGCGCDICAEAVEASECLISEDENNAIVQGEDGKLYVETFELPEGTEHQIITYDEEGNPIADYASVLNFVGPITEDIAAGSYLPLTVLDAEGNVIDRFTSRVAQAPLNNTTSIPERTATGQLRAQDPIIPLDVVNLRTLQDAISEIEDHYVESAELDSDTNVLTLTRTNPLDPLEVDFSGIVSDPIIGQYPQIVSFGENGEAEAQNLNFEHFIGSEISEGDVPTGTYLWASTVVGENFQNSVYEATVIPNDDGFTLQVPVRSSIGAGNGTTYSVLYSETLPDGITTNDGDILVNKSFLRDKVGFFREEVSGEAEVIDLSVVGETVSTQICSAVENTSTTENAIGMIRFTTLLSGFRMIGDGALTYTPELSFDGGSTWITLASLVEQRSGSGTLDTITWKVDNRGSQGLTVPPEETVIVCFRTRINVTTPFSAGSQVNVTTELGIIAGTEYPL